MFPDKTIIQHTSGSAEWLYMEAQLEKGIVECCNCGIKGGFILFLKKCKRYSYDFGENLSKFFCLLLPFHIHIIFPVVPKNNDCRSRHPGTYSYTV